MSKDIYIIGISAFYHDSAACLLKNDEIICAAQEERFTRVKNDHSFPINSIKYCLEKGKIYSKNIDYVVFYEKPFLKFERIFETYFSFAPKGLKNFINSLVIWVKEKFFTKNIIIKNLNENFDNQIKWQNKLLFSDHHMSHASSAFFPSPFEKAAILTIDGVGEWSTTSIFIGNKNKIKNLKNIKFPHSLGLLYSSFTYYAGFKVNSGEYKLMGLAPYGTPKYLKIIKDNLIHIFDDGSFHMNMSYFDYCTGIKMINNKFCKLFGGPARKSESAITQKEMDIAASIQKVLEEIILKIALNISKETGLSNLCLAGGVALNCVANGKLLKNKIFKEIWIQPASGDAGGCIGAAMSIYYMHLNKQRVTSPDDKMQGSLLGPDYNNKAIYEILTKENILFEKKEDDELYNFTANEIASGKVIGWFNGRSEFGPRALGNRSILADPRSEKMQKKLNLKIKFRESFRPFAPSILSDYVTKWFDLDYQSKYMLFVGNINKEKRLKINEGNELFGIDKLNIKRSIVPAITHVDYSSRIQTVDKKTNLKFYRLIEAFYKITGCPILINTSFNVRGEPIVNSPLDAIKCFFNTNMDLLIIENFVIDKNNQNVIDLKKYAAKFETD